MTAPGFSVTDCACGANLDRQALDQDADAGDIIICERCGRAYQVAVYSTGWQEGFTFEASPGDDATPYCWRCGSELNAGRESGVLCPDCAAADLEDAKEMRRDMRKDRG